MKTETTTAAELETIWQQFEQSPALMTLEQVERFEHQCRQEHWVTCRAGLAVLTRSGRDLIDAAPVAGAATLDELAECVASYAGLLRNLADAMDSAATRVRLARCVLPTVEAGAPQ